MKGQELHWTVTAEDVGARADVVLGRRIDGLSRRVARRLALEGRLQIDGVGGAPSERVSLGMRLHLRLPVTTETARAVSVVKITDNFIYAIKPAGMHTVALHPGDLASLATHIGIAHPECVVASPDRRESGAVQRLDRDTTGLVAFARSPDAWRRARNGFSRGEIVRRYLAIASAWPPSLPVDAHSAWLQRTEILPRFGSDRWLAQTQTSHEGWLVRAPMGASGRDRMEVRASGARAATTCHLLAESREERCTEVLVEVSLETGHRHQIRVHLAWLGCSVVGDSVYGTDSSAGLRLHAASIDFSHVFDTEVEIVVPPHDTWLSGFRPSKT